MCRHERNKGSFRQLWYKSCTNSSVARESAVLGEGRSGSFIPAWEGLVLILPPGEVVGPAGDHAREKTQTRRLLM